MVKTEDITKKEVLTEKEVLLLKRRLNHKKTTQEQVFDNFNKTFKIDAEMTAKGLKWLKGLMQTPRGIERKKSLCYGRK